MTDTALLGVWSWNKGKAAKYVTLARFQVFIVFFLGGPLSIYWALSTEGSHTINIIFAFAYTFSILVVFMSQRRKFIETLTWHGSRNITDVLPPSIATLIRQLCEDLGIDLRSFDVHLAARRFDANLSVLYVGSRFKLVITLGFLKLAESKPCLARAILAHELAHISQRDAALWPLLLIYSLLIKRVIIPFQILNMLISFYLAIDNINTLNANSSFQTYEINWAWWSYPHILGIGMPLIFLYWIRKMRFKSEELADLAAAAATSPADVRESLITFSGKSADDTTEDANSTHPPLTKRLNYLNYLESI